MIPENCKGHRTGYIYKIKITQLTFLNLSSASGDGFLSGCNCNDNFLNAFLISDELAFCKI